MKYRIIPILFLAVLSFSVIAQNSLELYNQQRPREEARQNLRQDKESLEKERFKLLAKEIVNKGLHAKCSVRQDYLENERNGYSGNAFYKGKIYAFDFWFGQSSVDAPHIVQDGQGYFNLNKFGFYEEKYTQKYQISGGGNIISSGTSVCGKREDVYLNERVMIVTEDNNCPAKDPKLTKQYCRIYKDRRSDL